MKIDNIGDSPGYLIEGLSRDMRRYSAGVLRKHNVGLTLEQSAVLMILMQNGALHQSELANIMSKDNPTLTRILDLLEKKTYLKREVSSTDRRKFRIVLTAEGKTKLTQVLPIIKQIRQTLFKGFSEKHMAQLKEIKTLIEANISD